VVHALSGVPQKSAVAQWNYNSLFLVGAKQFPWRNQIKIFIDA
jgi:hypothetical protein